MLRRRKTNTRYTRARNDRVLHLQVSSPRIVLFQSLRAMRGVLKVSLCIALLGFGAWYSYQYVQNHFLTNPEFSLKHLELKTNGYLNESEVANIAHIDPSGTVFGFDIDDAEALLLARPEIVTAAVERRLPDTVKVTLEERVPVAWVACPKLGMAGRNPLSGILMDADGVIFKCQGKLWDVARALPVIEIKEAERSEFQMGLPMTHKETERALSLVKRINGTVQGRWVVKRIAVVNFYSLQVTSNDAVEATFGMYEHERQLNDLIAARAHAVDTQRELSWINLLPKHNIPGQFKEPASPSGDELTSVND